MTNTLTEAQRVTLRKFIAEHEAEGKGWADIQPVLLRQLKDCRLSSEAASAELQHLLAIFSALRAPQTTLAERIARARARAMDLETEHDDDDDGGNDHAHPTQRRTSTVRRRGPRR